LFGSRCHRYGVRVDPERALALAYVPADRRAAMEALWRLDVALGSVLATGNDPMISRIRLAWWRESLEKLDRERPPAEPVLEAVARYLLPAGIDGAELAEMEQAWAALLSPEPLTTEELDLYSRERGGRLFALGARLLGCGAEGIEAGGEAWALIDLARRSGDAEAAPALDAAKIRPAPSIWPKPLRPLGMLALLANRDAERGLPLERQGSPARVWRMLRHGLTGR